MPSTSVLQEIMELPKCEDESGCRWIKADDVFRVIDGHLDRADTQTGRTIRQLFEEIADEQN